MHQTSFNEIYQDLSRTISDITIKYDKRLDWN